MGERRQARVVVRDEACTRRVADGRGRAWVWRRDEEEGPGESGR